MIDRHARHRRTPLDRHRRPVDGYRMRSTARFAHLVRDALRSLPPSLLAAFDAIDVAVGDIPDVHEDGEMVLATSQPADPATPDPRDRITLFRRPLEARASDRHDLRELLRDLLVQQLAELRGFDDGQLHDRGWP